MAAKRWPGLDGLRGVAILFVLVAHSQIIKTPVAGMVGVTVFFVLSGFLITYLLLDEKDHSGRINLKAFYGRRAARLLPALGAYLIGVAALVTVLRLGQPLWETSWPPALYVANYVQILGRNLYAHQHTWSLAVEEHFYLVWPVLLILGATRKLKWLTSGIVLLLVWRLGVGYFNPQWAYKGTDTNAYALGIGCLLAAVHRRGFRVILPQRTAEVAVAVLVLLSLVPAGDLSHLYTVAVWLPPLAAAAATACVLAAVNGTPVFLNGRSIRWLGKVSYALYLWHLPILGIPALARTPWTRFAAVALTIGIAALSWKLIEEPILRSRWRQRLTPKGREENSAAGLPRRPLAL